MNAEGVAPRKVQLERAFRLLNKSLETFYEKRYERAVMLCGESLEHLLPREEGRPLSPEEKGDLFLKTYRSVLPVQEAEAIAGVFTFFQSRKARFHFRRGEPLPDRNWWQFIRIGREEAEEVIQASRLALNTVKDSLPAEG
jgi:hypothetical protein